MKIILLILSLSIITAGSGRGPGVHILCYHGFNTNSNRFSFMLDELKSQLEYLKEKGFRFVNFSDIDNGNISGNRNILITVDDGNRSVYDAYYTVFRPMNIKPVLAIYPSIIGRKKYALTWEQLKQLSDEGCEVAAHGYSHRYLNSRLYKNENKAFTREIYLSKSVLEKKLGRSVDIFIYPYGVKSPEAEKVIRAAGYRFAFTIDKGEMPLSSLKGSSAYKLPRYMITRGISRKSFNLIAKSAGEGGEVTAGIKIVKKPGKAGVSSMAAVKPVKVTEPLRETPLKTVAYSGMYRDYKSDKVSPIINLDIQDSLVEPENKRILYPVDDYTAYTYDNYRGEDKTAGGYGIVDLNNYNDMYAYNAAALNGVPGDKDNMLWGIKRTYKRTAVSSYRYYSLWVDRMKTKIYTVRMKIEKLIKKIFT